MLSKSFWAQPQPEADLTDLIFLGRSDPLCGRVGDQRGDEERHSRVVWEGGDQGQGGDQTDEDQDDVGDDDDEWLCLRFYKKIGLEMKSIFIW